MAFALALGMATKKMKRYLLMAGANYYPGAGTSDWIECYETQSEAQEKVQEASELNCKYQINNCRYDWYEIIDLFEWME